MHKLEVITGNQNGYKKTARLYSFDLWSPNNVFFLNLGKNKICCSKCTKKCSGEVLRVAEKYFHKQCFQCSQCFKSLASGGFFSKDNIFYCTQDYQRLYGTRCAACKKYVEGEVVSTMGHTYHQRCFTCSRCSQPFQSGSKVSSSSSCQFRRQEPYWMGQLEQSYKIYGKSLKQFDKILLSCDSIRTPFFYVGVSISATFGGEMNP